MVYVCARNESECLILLFNNRPASRPALLCLLTLLKLLCLLLLSYTVASSSSFSSSTGKFKQTEKHTSTYHQFSSCSPSWISWQYLGFVPPGPWPRRRMDDAISIIDRAAATPSSSPILNPKWRNAHNMLLYHYQDIGRRRNTPLLAEQQGSSSGAEEDVRTSLSWGVPSVAAPESVISAGSSGIATTTADVMSLDSIRSTLIRQVWTQKYANLHFTKEEWP